MYALIDGDILRYELGYASELGWKAITGQEGVPPFEYVQEMLDQRIASILDRTGSEEYTLYLTQGRTFRYDIAVTKPYKGTRPEKKPFHFRNLTAIMKGCYPHKVVEWIEADDAMAIDAKRIGNRAIICSRDKDLKQVPGFLYSWELGKQSAFGPKLIDEIGTLHLEKRGKANKLTGTGFSWFCAQLLTGDVVDNIPGCNSVGPVGAFSLLNIEDSSTSALMDIVIGAYKERYGEKWEPMLLEQGRLCWIVRRLDEDGKPHMWQIGDTE